MDNTITRAEITAEARTWIGTRWQHQARLKGVACDCAGLVLGVGKAVGAVDQSIELTGYGREPEGDRMRDVCSSYLEEIAIADIQPGDVLLMAFADEPASHVAIVGDYAYGGLSIIHAFIVARKVVESILDDVMQSRIVAAYKYRGVI